MGLKEPKTIKAMYEKVMIFYIFFDSLQVHVNQLLVGIAGYAIIPWL